MLAHALGLGYDQYGRDKAEVLVDCVTYCVLGSAGLDVGSTLDALLEAREALRLLAGLPERQRNDLALQVAGFSYREIAEMTGGRTFTAVISGG